MMRMSLVLVLVLMTTGCTSMNAIYKNYDNLVDVKDGVTQEEAKIIAQKWIIASPEKRDYRISVPDIKSTPSALSYPDYWFVVFGHNWFSPISTDPMAKTYTQLRETQFLVVIIKATGQIKFAGLWYPKRANNFDWIFNVDGYKKGNPLALPPGVPSKKLF